MFINLNKTKEDKYLGFGPQENPQNIINYFIYVYDQDFFNLKQIMGKKSAEEFVLQKIKENEIDLEKESYLKGWWLLNLSVFYKPLLHKDSLYHKTVDKIIKNKELYSADELCFLTNQINLSCSRIGISTNRIRNSEIFEFDSTAINLPFFLEWFLNRDIFKDLFSKIFTRELVRSYNKNVISNPQIVYRYLDIYDIVWENFFSYSTLVPSYLATDEELANERFSKTLSKKDLVELAKRKIDIFVQDFYSAALRSLNKQMDVKELVRENKREIEKMLKAENIWRAFVMNRIES